MCVCKRAFCPRVSAFKNVLCVCCPFFFFEGCARADKSVVRAEARITKLPPQRQQLLPPLPLPLQLRQTPVSKIPSPPASHELLLPSPPASVQVVWKLQAWIYKGPEADGVSLVLVHGRKRNARLNTTPLARRALAGRRMSAAAGGGAGGGADGLCAAVATSGDCSEVARSIMASGDHCTKKKCLKEVSTEVCERV